MSAIFQYCKSITMDFSINELREFQEAIASLFLILVFSGLLLVNSGVTALGTPTLQ